MKQSKIEAAKKSIEQTARKHGVTVNEVKKEINIAMLNGLVSNDPQIKAFWTDVPCAGEYPTPEELVAYVADMVKRKKRGQNGVSTLQGLPPYIK